MNLEQESDPRQELVMRFLRQNKVQLWNEPFFSEGVSTISPEFIDTTANKCRIPYDVAHGILFKLQEHALLRVEENKLFSKEKLITIRVKLRGDEQIFQMKEDIHLIELFGMVGEAAKVPTNRLRLIHKGKLLEPRMVSIADFGIKNNSKIAALVISADVEKSLAEQKKQTKQRERLDSVKSNAKLASAVGVCQITNQFGVEVNLPDGVKMSLTCALALHNEARAKAKRGKNEDAMVFLLEAQELFDDVSSSNPEVLTGLSNIAQLNLDIVWCFLEMSSLNLLQDAEERLRIAEKNLNDTYGKNLEKVTKLKGRAVNELTFFTRLELLKGVLAYYKASFGDSKACFAKAESYISKLSVDDSYLNNLMLLGYSAEEARLALRQTGNDPDAAVGYLIKKKEDLEAEKEKWHRQKNENLLKGVDRGLHDKLINELGVPFLTAREALLKSGNDYQRACDLAMEIECSKNERKDETPSTSRGTADSAFDQKAGNSNLIDKCIKALIEMGETPDEALELAMKFKGNSEAVQKFLLTGEAPPWLDIEDLRNRLGKYISKEPEDYLDSTLEKETECLNTFKVRLAAMDSMTSP